MKENLIKQYNHLNNSFKKTLVFRIGESAGFFSEYNGMILAMLYCLHHKIRFVLYSKDANFKYKDGWTDYFEPFCESTSFWIHKYLNVRTFNTRKINIRDINIAKWQIKKFFHKVFAQISEPFISFLYTQNLWNKFFDKEMMHEYDIPDLEIKGDFIHACKRLVELTWRFNKKTKHEIDEIINQFSFPESYMSCHIRRGDKNIETDFVPLENYIEIIKSQNIRDIFVSTDDYSVIKELINTYPQWNWYSLCEDSEKGYNQANFNKASLTFRRKALIRLFAEVEILNKSKFFLGTKTSNPSAFMSFYNPDITKGVDCEGSLIIQLYFKNQR